MPHVGVQCLRTGNSEDHGPEHCEGSVRIRDHEARGVPGIPGKDDPWAPQNLRCPEIEIAMNQARRDSR
jgi:hypothetical protein